MEKQMKLRIFIYGTVFAIVIVVLDGMGVLGFTYPRAVENNPLLNPVRVIAVSSNSFTVADGRSFSVDFDHALFSRAVTNAGIQIELSDMGDGMFTVYTTERGWICGTPWARMITIPVIPESVPINRRRYAGIVELKEEKTQLTPTIDHTR
jgi:hypothetical protein